MNRNFIVNEETKTEIILLIKTLKNEFPRVLTRVTRSTVGYNVTIEGTDNDISKFINKLTDSGVVLNK